ncbi:MAG: hypothetical protein ACRBF0_04195 [Calditrichia bacterium]
MKSLQMRKKKVTGRLSIKSTFRPSHKLESTVVNSGSPSFALPAIAIYFYLS